MKIIRCDNYDREGPGHDDVLVASGITSIKEAKVMLDALREKCRPAESEHYYQLHEDAYVLKEFKP